MSSIRTAEDKTKYSELLSSCFCSVSILTLSLLSLLNSLSLDFYSMVCLLKVVFPAAICFWFLGHVIGTILDNYSNNISTITKENETKAYEIPSIFSDTSAGIADDDLGVDL